MVQIIFGTYYTVNAKNKFTYRTWYVCGTKKKKIWTNRTANALRSYFHCTFTVSMPYLFRRIYYSDELKYSFVISLAFAVLLIASYRCFLSLLFVVAMLASFF